MKSKKIINFGIIGCGLMGRELASAMSRWCHLEDVNYLPRVTAVCDIDLDLTKWFSNNFSTVELVTEDYRKLLDTNQIDAVYCAVPHNLHASVYSDIIQSGKNLLGEKPFGINLKDNQQILSTIQSNPGKVVSCSSQFPFYPGIYQLTEWIRENRFGNIIDVEVCFWHCSDLDPNKPINWKRQLKFNGEYGCLGDLGMHAFHIPMRFGWKPGHVSASLSNIVKERPSLDGSQLIACETWDNAILLCDVEANGQSFPMQVSTKRIAPGHSNTWSMSINGTEFSAKYTLKVPKQIHWLDYYPGAKQIWQCEDLGMDSAYETITGKIFEFGFSDSILQMLAAYCDELINGRENMAQPFYCATPEEAASTHRVFTAALHSYKNHQKVAINWD